MKRRPKSALIAVQSTILLPFLRRDINISACHLKVISVLDLVDVFLRDKFGYVIHLDQSMNFVLKVF